MQEHEIEVNFSIYMPELATFYNYFEILKSHAFIQDVKVIDKEGHSTLRIYRDSDELSLKK